MRYRHQILMGNPMRQVFLGAFPFAFPGNWGNDGGMRHLAIIALGSLLGTWALRAEPRTFTNTDGKTVEAELLTVEGDFAVLKLPSGKGAKVPLKSLSESDQSYITAWWAENKDKLKPMDVRLAIDKKTDRIDRKITRSGSTGAQRNGQSNQVSPIVKKLTIDEFKYIGELKSYVRKGVADIAVEYTIYKRVSTNDKEGLKSEVEEIDGTDTIRLLEALGSATFETEAVQCEDTSESGGNKPRTSKRETILGVVFTLSAGGEDFLKQSDPENLLERLEEEEKR
jgi:hypothetical protein